MASTPAPDTTAQVDWAAACGRMAAGVRRALDLAAPGHARAEVVGRGEGGDSTTAIDRAAEDAVVRELETVAAGGARSAWSARSSARGTSAAAVPTTVVVDPIDGSLNAKRGLPFFCLSVAVADGSTVGDVRFGAVHDLVVGEAWVASRGAGRDRRPGAARRGAAARPVRGRAPRGDDQRPAGQRGPAALDGHCSRVRAPGRAGPRPLPARRRAAPTRWRPLARTRAVDLAAPSSSCARPASR